MPVAPAPRPLLNFLVFVTLLIQACSSGPQTRSGTPAGGSDHAAGTFQTKQPLAGDAAAAAKLGSAVAVFDTWCASAGQTSVTQGPLATQYAALCLGGKATTLFAQTLMASAYSGTGAPALVALQDPTSQGSITSAGWASAVALPMSAASQYQLVAPLAGQEASQTAHAIAAGTSVRSMQVTPNQVSASGSARGWLIHLAASAGAVAVPLETIQQHDQYILSPAQLYMYVETTQQGIKTIHKRDELTAVVQVGTAAYLFTVSSFQVDNQGFAQVAADQIHAFATATAQTQYSDAAQLAH